MARTRRALSVGIALSMLFALVAMTGSAAAVSVQDDAGLSDATADLGVVESLDAGLFSSGLTDATTNGDSHKCEDDYDTNCVQ